jgi:3-methyladenine DNA glycosylase AlkC
MTTPRKGARRRADIPPSVLRQLSHGEIPSATLVEILALDMATLISAALPGAPDAAKALRAAASAATGIVQRMELGGRLLAQHADANALKALAAHTSDTVRGWTAYALVRHRAATLKARTAAARPFADDAHSGVREWAWMALRPAIAEAPEAAVALLAPWSLEPSANLRRFASEATRPRGVWCAHIHALRNAPHIALPILEPLKSDPSRYVQDSVANWLNDASKDAPDWVQTLCARWQRESPTPETERTCTRALRTLNKVPRATGVQPKRGRSPA